MSIRINQLRCRVNVTGKRPKSTLNQNVDKDKPSMTFALPLIQARAEQPFEPMETSSSTSNVDEQVEQAAAVDPRQVADRVYELMKREIQLGRLRGERN